MLSALPLAAALSQSAHVLFTTGTVTSASLLAQRLEAEGLSAVVTHRFVPLDVPAWASRFVAHWRPDAAVFVESDYGRICLLLAVQGRCRVCW